jgi:hypothetical protein
MSSKDRSDELQRKLTPSEQPEFLEGDMIEEDMIAFNLSTLCET